MVKIVDFKTYQKDDGEKFFALVVQGGVEAVMSKVTNRLYLTARKVNVACTFDEVTCKSLIGTDFPGSIQKVQSNPYEYAIPNTGEIITLTHKYEYVNEEQSIVKDNVIEQEMVM